MSIATDLKDYADAAVESGRAALNEGLTQVRTVVDEGFDGANERAARLAGTAAGLRAQAAGRARVTALAAVGVSDVAVSTLLERVQGLPTDVVGTVGRVQTSAAAIAGRWQDRVTSAAGAVDGVRSGAALGQVRRTAEAYGTLLSESRDALAKRGEDVLGELRGDPRVRRAVGLADRAGDTVVEGVADATEAIEDAAARPARRRAGEQAAATRARSTRRAADGAAATRRTRGATTGAGTTSAPARAKKAAARTSTARTSTARATAARTSTARATAARTTAARAATASGTRAAKATGTRTGAARTTRGSRSSSAR